MNRHSIKIATIILVAVGVIGAAVWSHYIQPKNTRLAFYEIFVASKNAGQNTDEQMSSWVQELNTLKKDHLKPCEQIQYHNALVKLERQLQVGDRETHGSASSLQTAARKYFEDTPSLETLQKIGETEFSDVSAEIDAFKQALQNSGYTKNLDELASRPQNNSSNLSEIKEIYTGLILRAEENLTSRFYDYDIPKASAKVIKNKNWHSAYASYHAGDNAMIAYFDELDYPTDIAGFISVHEIFPGHHLSTKARLDKPLCAGDPAVFPFWLIEGWATYAEFIADEEGFFDRPEHRLAWLDYRLTRAMRLILDVERMRGIDEYDKLLRLWEDRMPERLHHRFDREFARLNKRGHQHLGYILGYNAIAETKAKLMSELGADFDERRFHDSILRMDTKDYLAFYDTVKIGMEISQANQ